MRVFQTQNPDLGRIGEWVGSKDQIQIEVDQLMDKSEDFDLNLQTIRLCNGTSRTALNAATHTSATQFYATYRQVSLTISGTALYSASGRLVSMSTSGGAFMQPLDRSKQQQVELHSSQPIGQSQQQDLQLPL